MNTWRLSPASYAEHLSCTRACPSHTYFRRNVTSPRSVIAEWIQRNNKIGVQERVPVRLTTWTNVRLDENDNEGVELDAYIGLSDRHQLVSVIHVGGRCFARSLSGKRKIGAYFVTEQGEVYALDEAGRLLRFETDLWKASPLLSLTKRAVWNSLITAGLLTLAIAGLSEAIFDPDVLAQHWFAIVALPASFTSIGGAAIHAWLASLRFESRNRHADGMHASHIQLGELKGVEPVVDDSQQVSDYRIITSSGQHSLSQLAHLDRKPYAKSHLRDFNAGREDLLRLPLPSGAVFTQD